MIWPFKKSTVVPPEVRVIVRDRCEVTLSEWRSEGTLVSGASRLLSEPHFRLMLDVLNTASPAGWVLNNSSTEERAAQQARIEGYQMAITNLKSMGIFQKSAVNMPEPEFKPEIFEEKSEL